MSALFLAGTDTGVGKTFVGCALALALRARGRRVAVVKPVETGVEGEPEDALRLRAVRERAGALISEVFHRSSSAASRTAATMLG